MSVITVSHLKKYFSIHKRGDGFAASIQSIFHRKKETVKAVDDVSFEINEGELVGFIGPNGAGKTTTLKCLSGLLYPSSGTVGVLGFTPVKRQGTYLKQISLIMGQKNQLWWDLPAIDTFRLNKEIYEISDEAFEKSLDELLELLDADGLTRVPVRQLSLGQRMKMELIASLLHRPKVLFLDEPTIGLDVLMQKKMREFIKEYNIRNDATILLTSHYMKDVKELCKRILIINHGNVVFDGQLTELIKKHADFKILSVTFNKEIEKKDLKEIGTFVSFSANRVVLKVPRPHTKTAAERILKRLPVEDLDIEEPEIEDVIRFVFEKSK